MENDLIRSDLTEVKGFEAISVYALEKLINEWLREPAIRQIYKIKYHGGERATALIMYRTVRA